MINSIKIKLIKWKYIYIQFLLILTIYLALVSCASISAPQGGRKDTKPPVFLYSNPAQNTLNFKAKKITLNFNEQLDIAKLKEKLIINPDYKAEYEIDQSGKQLIISLKDTLESNKTYTFDFQDGLKDNHEGMNIKHFKLVFSTGIEIDSSLIYGKVIDAYSKKPMINYTVGLYKTSDTTRFENKKPIYKTHTNSIGIYHITNIKEDNYEIYAFNDINKNQLINTKTENIGYSTEPINTREIKDSLVIETTHNDINKPKLLSIKNDAENEISFDEGLFKYQIESNEKLYHELSKDKKQIIIYKTKLCEDSIPIKIIAVDSSNNDTTINIKISQSTPKKFKTFKDILKTVEPDSKYTPTDSLPITITTNYPIVNSIDSGIVFTNDSISFKYTNLLKDFKANTANTEFTYTYKRKSKQFLQLNIKPNSMHSYTSDTNTKISQKYSKLVTNKEDAPDDSYAKVNIKTNAKHFIIELLDNKDKITSTYYNIHKLSFVNLKPAKYSIRIIEDGNNNKKWDPGNYKEKTQSERTIIYKEILDIRANWDIEDVEITF